MNGERLSEAPGERHPDMGGQCMAPLVATYVTKINAGSRAAPHIPSCRAR